ncbi:DUF3060 domain-containing protein [Longispora albida]|uniref:DUF3060 domain-containing protein n=1 Tax=Longispora albida TaxID=203523 RepID=UPI00035F4613|nr:DUF3060 domain-containing protein [Longispora albida]
MRKAALFFAVTTAALTATAGCTATIERENAQAPAPSAIQSTAPAGPAPARGGATPPDMVVSGTGVVESFDCTGQNVTVEASAGTITLKGNCLKLVVSGSVNTISADQLAEVRFVRGGGGNTVVYKGPAPETISDTSNAPGNTVTRRAI